MSAVARAHPNIALIKYWGKAQGAGNIPAVPSLSITLDTLTTTTLVSEASADSFQLNGRQVFDAKLDDCLRNLRRHHPVPPVTIQSSNDFPTAAGLASSASGFAALVTAIDAAFGLGMEAAERSDMARQASASAARSVYGGFVSLVGPDWRGRELLGPDAWPLRVVIAVTETASKAVSSSEGMSRSAATSPYYRAWVESAPLDYATAADAVATRDFAALAELAEHSCLKMHALMLSSRPALVYWNAATVACLHRIRDLRAGGEAVFFTADAGPQVKAVCLPASEPAVRDALGTVPGVHDVVSTGLGAGAWVGAA